MKKNIFSRLITPLIEKIHKNFRLIKNNNYCFLHHFFKKKYACECVNKVNFFYNLYII